MPPASGMHCQPATGTDILALTTGDAVSTGARAHTHGTCNQRWRACAHTHSTPVAGASAKPAD
eukprot:1153984-Pelagomonas_calceolata.AAC.5